MRSLSLFALAVWLCLATAVFADDSSDAQSAPPAEDQVPAGPALLPNDFTPVICDPSASAFRYVEVRGSGFDAWASQRLAANLVDASGAQLERWPNVYVSPQGLLTLEVNLCADRFQNHPALPAGDYTLAIGPGNGTIIATTAISLAEPPSPDEEDTSVPAPVAPTPQPTSTPFTYVIPTLPSQPTPTPLPIASLAAPAPTAGPRTGAGTRAQPVPQGAPGNLADGWQLVIQGVTPDSFDGIKAAIPSAITPASDQRDFMIRAQATYLGPGTGVFSGVRLALLNTVTQQTYDQIANSCGVIPDPLVPGVVTQGSAVRGNVCFTVRASDIGSLVALDNQPVDNDKVYFALQ